MSFRIGDRVGPYKVVGELGAGGVGRVFRVEHSITGRVEAMKILLADGHSDPQQSERFLREIKIQARLSHPNVASVHNALWTDDTLVMIMELVAGESLDTCLDGSALPLSLGIDYMSQALSALSYAHAQGVIHRDIKPANMIVTPEGRVKVTDFGLAKTENDPRLTQTGAVMGSPYYISPEQVRGVAGQDERTDIYSLGAVFYEVATGKKPFDFEQPFELMTAHVQQPPLPPVEVDPSIPPSLSDVILRALAKEPADRFASADEFLAALQPAARSLNGTKSEGSSTARGTVDLEGITDSLGTPSPVVPQEAAAPNGSSLSPETSAEQAGSRPPLSARLPASRSVALVGSAVVLLVLVFVLGDSGGRLAPERAAPPNSIAVASGQFHLVRKLSAGGDVSAVALGPETRRLAAATGDSAIEVWNIATGKRERVLRGHSSRVNAVAFSPDGKGLAYARSDRAVQLWDLTGSKPQTTLSHRGGVTALVFSRDGRRLATADDEAVILWDAANGRQLRRFDYKQQPHRLTISSDNRWLAASSTDRVSLWNLSEPGEYLTLEGPENGAQALAFSPDGRSLASTGGDGLRVWDVHTWRERPSIAIPGEPRSLAFSADGVCRVLAVSPESIRLWDTNSMKELGAFHHTQPVRIATLSSDGRQAVTATDGGDLWIWETTGSP